MHIRERPRVRCGQWICGPAMGYLVAGAHDLRPKRNSMTLFDPHLEAASRRVHGRNILAIADVLYGKLRYFIPERAT